MTRTALGYLFTVEWAVYLGGALFMELVWRPLQRHLAPAQTGALCNAMGRRYRWLALVSLGLIAVTAVAWQVVGGSAPPASDGAGAARAGSVEAWRAVVLAGTWAVLVALVTAMGLLVHPRSHARVRRAEDAAALRRRRLRAIRAMDVLLRAELAVALTGALAAAWPHAPGPGQAL